ncbi:multi-sensor hybrid histidine kinase [Emticicia oligotrophica DSM 17448]|uniref:histidine kinase n=1 Tax=Emticicia oligotrophica (strain DSM 17448 / CIP 109782 / MTCC 6937 / GPTSA100-15) TaxID=929562 RepID=A0ABM5N694_EMTOG|nr:PAS domain-containing hybrid sensor histidine kinase/response regulator [Emticicia oligotrophica]AFK04976.1 multi-sensor hybrid histidine kinase [Emticicia oligotrophica DSM 17448]
MSEEIEALKRKIEREKKARQQAESLLEAKAMELFQANEDLKRLNESLERRVTEQTEQLRYSEEKYRGIIENMNLGLIEVDNNDIIMKAYRRFCELTGYEEAELVGKKAADILLPDDEFKRIIDEQNSNRLDGDTGVYEVPLRKKDGEIIWVIISGAPIIESSGKVTGSVGIHLDITERKKTQEALEEARQIAEEARRAEKRFLANMSHEIRTPINAIIGMTHLLYDTNPNKKQTEYLSAINYSADLLLNLVSDVLDISKIEAGEMKLSEQIFSLKDLINSTLQTFRLRLQGKDVKLVFDFDEEIENDVIGDSTFLTQILMNLLSNAVKFTEKGEIGVQVSLLCRLGDFLMTEVKVFDTGIGISPQNIDKIFDSFKQADQDVKVKYGGTGLGLAIVKQLVNLHGGEINVESTLNEGTAFIFTLPLKDSKQQSKKLHALNEDISEEWKNYHVLVVEDNLLNQKYVEGLLLKWKMSYKITSNGLLAVEAVKKEDFDIILMDIRMPEMNGYEATKVIRSMEGNANQNIPIVALTASAMSDEIGFAYEIGMNSYLTKPFTPDQLRDVLKQKLTLNPHKKLEIKEKNIVSSVEEKKDLAIVNEVNLEEALQPDYLAKVYGNDRGYAADMFNLFLKTVPNQFFQLRPLIDEQKIVEIGKLAHQLKPSFTMVGLPEITLDLQNLEKKAKNNEDIDEILSLFNEIEEKFNQKLPLVEQELVELRK